MENEIYKTIEGYNDSYEVSNYGNVRSLERLVYNNKFKGKRKVSTRILKPKTKYNLYKEVKLGKKMFYVHRLVAQAFIGQIKLGCNVNHKDGNKGNNRLDNLEIVTFSENTKHAIYSHLLKPPPPMYGSKNPKAKLDEQKVIELREFYSKNGLKSTVTKYTDVSKSTICKIVYNITWKHVTPNLYLKNN